MPRREEFNHSPLPMNVDRGQGLWHALAALLVCSGFAGQAEPPHAEISFPSNYVARVPGTITFARDIAPIVYEHCSGCHRSGQSGPFTLMDYTSVKKRSRVVAEVVGRRYMPPWQPEDGYGEFAGERRLST